MHIDKYKYKHTNKAGEEMRLTAMDIYGRIGAEIDQQRRRG